MLALYTDRGIRGKSPTDLTAGPLPGDVLWIDLLKPDPAEIAFVERTTGLTVPTIEELSEIESSSRLRVENGALYMSAPLLYRADSDLALGTPVGFVLTRDRLVTVRFEELASFTTLDKRIVTPETERLSSVSIFVELMEAVVDRLADVLERIASELDALSHRLFRANATQPLERRPPAQE